MKQFACIIDEKVTVLNEEEVTEHILQGERFEHIFELGREMEIQIRLVPTKKTAAKKAKPLAENEEKAEADGTDEAEEAETNGVSATTKAKKRRSRANA